MENVVVNRELYDFLKTKECMICKENGEIKTFCFISFADMEEFTKIIGYNYFNDDVDFVMAVIKYDSVCFPLNDVFDGEGTSPINYKPIFNVDDFADFEEELRKEWR